MPSPIAMHFAEAWRPLDPLVAAVLERIYTAAAGQPHISELTPDAARRVVAVIQFLLRAGAPALPHIDHLGAFLRRVTATQGAVP